jgi:hypothetical protein
LSFREGADVYDTTRVPKMVILGNVFTGKKDGFVVISNGQKTTLRIE